MKVLVLVALAVAVSARPDVGLLYRPQATTLGGTAHYHPPGNTYIPSAPANNFQTPYQQSGSFSSGVNAFGQTQGGQVITQYRNRYDNQQGGTFGQGTNQGFTQTSYSHYNSAPQITKHAYFYEAPEEYEVGRTRVHVPIAPPRKNIKLIFIKAPSYGSNAHIVAPQQQDEEKTHVYVLVKKPDDAHDITIPTPAPIRPSKPEVFFVKYKTQQEAEDKISATLQGAQGAGNIANALDGEVALINSIARDAAKTQHAVGVTVDNYGAAGGNQQTATGFDARIQETTVQNGAGNVLSASTSGSSQFGGQFDVTSGQQTGSSGVIANSGQGVSTGQGSSSGHYVTQQSGYRYKK